jgi:hypothetical protein
MGALLLGMVLVRLGRRDRGGESGTSPWPPSPPERVRKEGPLSAPIVPSPLPSPAPPAVLPGPEKTGRHIRLRRPDGTYEVVEETVELINALTTGAMQKTIRLFEETQRAFREKFNRTLVQGGPATAWQLVEPYLRTPGSTNEDKALVAEAIQISLDLARELGQRRSSAYEPIRTVATESLARFLTSPEVHAWTQSLTLMSLAGLKLIPSAAGAEVREIEGLPAYDPQAPWEAYLLPDPLEKNLLNAARPPNPALASPELVQACRHLVEDGDAPADLRGCALRALATREGALGPIQLDALAQAGPRELAEAAVDVLGMHPETLRQGLFFSLMEAHADPQWKTVVFERLSSGAFATPQMMSLLMADLPGQPMDFAQSPEAGYHATVLQVSLERYAKQNEPALRDLLVGRLSGWAPYAWPLEGSPVVAVAEFAAEHGLKELRAPLQAVLGTIASPEDRASIQSCLGRIGR